MATFPLHPELWRYPDLQQCNFCSLTSYELQTPVKTRKKHDRREQNEITKQYPNIIWNVTETDIPLAEVPPFPLQLKLNPCNWNWTPKPPCFANNTHLKHPIQALRREMRMPQAWWPLNSRPTCAKCGSFFFCWLKTPIVELSFLIMSASHRIHRVYM